MKDDAISRQAVLGLIYTLPPEDAMVKAMLIKSVQQLESVQPVIIKTTNLQQTCNQLATNDIDIQETDGVYEHCDDCIHEADSIDICILRQCKHAIAELKECYEPKQPDRKRGKWIDDGDPFMWECGCCGYRVKRYNNTRYCPNCGADMRGETE